MRVAGERAARAVADDMKRGKDVFLATLSRELRTPLNAIYGWTRMLRTGRMNKQHTARALEAIERNSILQGQLVNKLLDVSGSSPASSNWRLDRFPYRRRSKTRLNRYPRRLRRRACGSS